MKEIEFLKMLSDADYVEMFEVIDYDGIRKHPVHDIKSIRLTVDWRLLNKWQDESEECKK